MAGESCFRYFQNANTPFLACRTCHNHVAALQGRIQLSLPRSTFWKINISCEHTVNLSVLDPPYVLDHLGCICVDLNCTMCKKVLGQTIVASYFPNDHYKREGRHILYLPQLALWDGFRYKNAIQIMENESAFSNLTELDVRR